MYNEEEARDLVIEAGNMLVRKRLVARTWGNISARVGDDEFIITPSGKAYEALTSHDLVKVRISDLSYDGDIKPSSEKGVHAIAYKLRPEVDFIVHTHQFYASVLAADLKDTEAAPCARYALPGTRTLIKNVGEVIKANPDKSAFLMARHGALILGRDMDEAFDRANVLEAESRKIFTSRVPEKVSTAYGNAITAPVALSGIDNALLVRDPYVMEICDSGMPLNPYIDDFAMIVGPDAAIAGNKLTDIRKALRGRNAVMVRDIGAICTGRTAEDAEAVAMIVSKNAAAACYIREPKPLGFADARLQRYVYQSKYSKQKDA